MFLKYCGPLFFFRPNLYFCELGAHAKFRNPTTTLSWVFNNSIRKKKKERNSAAADGGPRARVCARLILRSAPHQHQGNFPTPLDNFWKYPLIVRGKGGSQTFFGVARTGGQSRRRLAAGKILLLTSLSFLCENLGNCGNWFYACHGTVKKCSPASRMFTVWGRDKNFEVPWPFEHKYREQKFSSLKKGGFLCNTL